MKFYEHDVRMYVYLNLLAMKLKHVVHPNIVNDIQKHTLKTIITFFTGNKKIGKIQVPQKATKIKYFLNKRFLLFTVNLAFNNVSVTLGNDQNVCL